MRFVKFNHVMLVSMLMLLQACASVDHPGYFQRYEQAFKEKTGYKTHFVERDGLKIHVREFGRKTTKPTWVLMHGFPDSMHLYDRLVPELLDNQHVITFDFIGWGDSDKPANHRYDFASLRADLEAVVEQLDLKRVVLVVHDASGPVGIDWSFDNQDKTAGLVLLNTFYSPMPTLKAPEEIAVFSTPGIKRWVSVLATRLSDSLLINRYNAQIARFISSESLREPFQKVLGHQFLKIRPAFYGLNRALRAELERNAARTARLASFRPPVRIIFGEDDPYLNVGVARDFDKLYGDADLFLIKGAGHFVQVDKPERVAKLIKALAR